MLETLRHDASQAFRSLRQTPVFALTAIVTLALALGANAAVFSLLNALVFRRLPVPNPEQLVQVATRFRTIQEGPLSFPMFRELGSRQSAFSSVIGWWGDAIFAVDTDEVFTQEVVIGVTGNFYSELGALPSLGRLIVPADVNLDSFRSAPVAVLGHGFWQRRFGGDSDVIGRTVRVQGVPFEVVGVAPRGFKGFGLLSEPDVTLPLTVYPDIFRSAQLNYPNAGNVLWMKMAGRLRPNVNIEDARAQLEAVWPAIKSDIIPPTHAGAQRDNFLAMALDIRSLATGHELFLRPQFTRPTFFVSAIALVILLIASVNLASLMLPHVASRSHELAVRAALGASRFQAVRHILLEGGIVAVVGGVIGLSLGSFASTAIASVILPDAPTPVSLNTSPDLRVLIFTAVLAVAAAALCVLPSAWVAARRDSRFGLQRSGYSITRFRRLGRFLIAGQVALSILLLTHAGLFVRSWQKLLSTDLGFTSEGVVLAGFMTRPEVDQRPDIDTYYPALVDRVRTISGVASVSITQGGLASGSLTQQVSLMTSEPVEGIPAAFNAVSPGFFGSLDVSILHGRDFSWSDRARSPRVAILSESLARQLFHGRDPIGQRVRIGTQPHRQNLEVIGIVADAKLYEIKAPLSYAAYAPAVQLGEFTVAGQLVIRGAVTEDQLQQAVRSVGPDYVTDMRSLPEMVDRAIGQDRVTAAFGGLFGVLTLLLAAIGVGGLMAYTVAQRRKEIAIRLAIGAQARRVMNSVLKEGLIITCAGAALGFAAGVMTTRLIRGMLFGVSPYDPVVLVTVPILLVAVAGLACAAPAIRAARIDPIISLRAE